MNSHILVVDDEKDFALPLTDLLCREGFTADASFTTKEAERKALAQTPDVLVLDLLLDHGSNGLDTLSTIRRRVPDVGCLLVTGYGSEQTRARARDLGVQAYLEKPFELQTALEIVRLLAERHELLNGKNGVPPCRLSPLGDIGLETLRVLLEQLPVGIALVDKASQVTYATPRALEVIRSQDHSKRTEPTRALPESLQGLIKQARQPTPGSSLKTTLLNPNELDRAYTVSALRLDQAGTTGDQPALALIFEESPCRGLLECPLASTWLKVLLGTDPAKKH